MMKKSKIAVISFIISGVVLCSVGILFSFGKKEKNTPENTIMQYCNILIDGNYGDMINLTYFPESEFITDEKKQMVYEKIYDDVKEEYRNVIDCQYSTSKETDESVEYKVIFDNGDIKQTEFIEVEKETNKIISTQYYKEEEIYVYSGSKVFVDENEIPAINIYGQDKDTHKDIYKMNIVKDATYDLKILHPLFKDIEIQLDDYYRKSGNYAILDLKENYKAEFQEEMMKILGGLFIAVLNDEDITRYNSYFKNVNAKEFSEVNYADTIYKLKNGHKEFKYDFIKINKLSFSSDYLGENEFSVEVYLEYNCIKSRKDGQKMYYVDGNTLKSAQTLEETHGLIKRINNSFDNVTIPEIIFTCSFIDGKIENIDWK